MGTKEHPSQNCPMQQFFLQNLIMMKQNANKNDFMFWNVMTDKTSQVTIPLIQE